MQQYRYEGQKKILTFNEWALFDRWAWAQERGESVYLRIRRDVTACDPGTQFFLSFSVMRFSADVSGARQRRQPSHGGSEQAACLVTQLRPFISQTLTIVSGYALVTGLVIGLVVCYALLWLKFINCIWRALVWFVTLLLYMKV